MAITKKTSSDILKKQNLNGIDTALVSYKHLYEATDNIEDRLDALEDGDVPMDSTTPPSGTFTVNGDLAAANGTFSGVLTGSSVNAPINTTSLTIDTYTVTQITSITTGVSVTKRTGVITTVSSTLAAQASAEFVVTATGLTAASARIFTNVLYTGAGIPVVTISAKGASSFTIKIYNAHATNAFNNTLAIDYMIVL